VDEVVGKNGIRVEDLGVCDETGLGAWIDVAD